MTTLSTVLPFAKIIGAFFLMLVCIRFKVSLWLSVLIGTLSVVVFYGLKFSDWFEVAALALVQEKFLFLVSIVGLILVLSDGLERSGQSRRLMEALSGYLRYPRFRLFFFPALIGLLPMPGGAVFSAPMVKEVSQGMSITNADRVLINYWFRHVWELAWPLYPGIILTVALAEIPLSAFISRSWPGVIAMLVLGWFFFLRPINGETLSDNPIQVTDTANHIKALKEAVPLLIAIIGGIGLETLFANILPNIAFEWGVIFALLAACVSIMRRNRLGLKFLRDLLGKKSLWAMIGVIAAIFIFKDTMQAAGVVRQMSEAGGDGAALFAAALLLPFLVGMVSGINVAFVGSVFPLLLGLLDILHLQQHTIAYLVLATFCGFTGVMISPIHICFMLSCEYFGTELVATWKRLVLPCLVFAAAGLCIFYVLL